MTKHLKKLNNPAFIAVLLLIVYIVSLIPILYTANFAHPFWDDFGYSADVH